MSSYKIVMRSSGAVAAFCCVVYTMSLIFAHIDGSGGVEIPSRFGSIVISVTVLCAIISVVGWMIQWQADRVGRQIAAEATLAVAGVMEQQLRKCAEQTASKATAYTVATVREMLDQQCEVIEMALGRAHTRGMVSEAASRANGAGNVASISRGRDT